MCSADARTARQRILDVALEQFGRHGPSEVSMRDIAREAGVSPALVVHHFGSKDRLRGQVDAAVVDVLTEAMSTIDADDAEASTGAFFQALAREGHVLAYLARALPENDDLSASLVDTLVHTARERLEAGVAEGWATPTDDPLLRAVLVTFYDLGMLVLRGHAQRLLGVDLLSDEGGKRWMHGALELYREGLFR